MAGQAAAFGRPGASKVREQPWEGFGGIVSEGKDDLLLWSSGSCGCSMTTPLPRSLTAGQDPLQDCSDAGFWCVQKLFYFFGGWLLACWELAHFAKHRHKMLAHLAYCAQVSSPCPLAVHTCRYGFGTMAASLIGGVTVGVAKNTTIYSGEHLTCRCLRFR